MKPRIATIRVMSKFRSTITNDSLLILDGDELVVSPGALRSTPRKLAHVSLDETDSG